MVALFVLVMMLAAWVVDGGFGIVIGEPSSSAPSAFGSMLFFTLPTARIEFQVSSARFIRPDQYSDQSTLHPDILVDARYSLDVALNFLRDL